MNKSKYWLQAAIFLFFLCETHATQRVELQYVSRWFEFDHNWTHVAAKETFMFGGTETNGWHVIDATNPLQPRRVFTNTFPYPVRDMEATVNTLFVVNDRGVLGYDITNPREVAVTGVNYDVMRGIFDVSISRTWAWGISDRGVYQFGRNMVTGSQPEIRTFWDLSIAANDSYLYLWELGERMKVYDLSWPLGPLLVKYVPESDPIYELELHDGLLIARGDAAVWVYDLVDPKNPKRIATYNLIGSIAGMRCHDGLVYLAKEEKGVEILDISNAREGKIFGVGSYNTAGSAQDIAVSGDYLYVADGTNGMVILKQVIRDAVPLSITQQPQNQTVNIGDTVELSVEATGTPPLSYYWWRDRYYLGRNTNRLVLTNVTKAQSGLYTVQVLSALGGETILSSTGTVRVLGGISLQPRGKSAMRLTCENRLRPFDKFTLLSSTNLTTWKSETDVKSVDAYTIDVNLKSYISGPRTFFKILEVP